MTKEDRKASKNKKPHTQTTTAQSKGRISEPESVEAAPEGAAIIPVMTVAQEHEQQQQTITLAPVKKSLTTEQTFDLGVTKMVKDELRDRERERQIDMQLEKLRGIITSLGLEVPPDESEDEEISFNGKRSVTRVSPNGKGKAGGKGLWGIIEGYLSQYGYIEPKFCEASKLVALAENYTTAANLLSQRSRAGDLAKQGRGRYALPRGWKKK